MLSENVWLCASIQIVLFATLQAQAPEDGSDTCRNPPFTKPPFPSNIVPLLDSYDYLGLLGTMGTWKTQDVDGDSRTWSQPGDTACRQVPGSCSYTFGPQNNWLITQHINTTVNGVALSQVVVRVNFSLNGCLTGGSCQQSFLLQTYQTQNIDPSGSLNATNYASFPGNRVTVGSNPTGTVVETQDVMVPLGAIGGMYLAAQETGTCVSISRLIVFHYMCPQQVVNFISYPMAMSNGAITQLACVSGASLVGVQLPLATCGSQGVWGAPNGGCSCNFGYTSIGQSCQSCPPGTYKSVQGSSVCLPCPSNSNSSVNGSSQCPCLPGYYRPASSGADSDCIASRPPSAPQNLNKGAASATSVVLSWSPPQDSGGTGIVLYTVYYQAIISGSLRMTWGNVTTTSVTVTNLLPATEYIMTVVAQNGEPGDEADRSVSLRVTTLNTASSNPSSISTPIIVGVLVGVLLPIAICIGICIVVPLLVWSFCYRPGKGVYLPQTSSEMVDIPQNKGTRMYVDPRTYQSTTQAVSTVATEIPPKYIKLVEEIGGGEFGTVYKGMWNERKPPVPIAVKTLKPGSSDKMRDDFLTEASIMGQFHHPNVIKLYGVITKVEPAMIIMEFMDNGSLYYYLRHNDEKLSLQQLLKMACGVAAGMQYLSEVGYVHRDLAARNILVSKDEVCKVADFGLSRETTNDEYDVKKGGKIPVRWTAPEAISYRKFTTASDVWSYGVLLWEVMSYGQQPYEDWDNQMVLDKLESGYRLQKPKDCPSTVYELMQSCWSAEHTDRPTFKELVRLLDAMLESNNKDAPIPKPRTRRGTFGLGRKTPLDYQSIEAWLEAIKMDRYVQNFHSQGLKSIQDVLLLAEEDLRGMGVAIPGHVNKIMSSVRGAHQQMQREASVRV
uniref:Protein tyrosine kinase n=1 Tax=Ephydatia fluviatilis TaxID=31330 RepID=Q9Y1Y3_9METZ|nr:protein tyrosine kinase [Ephydatia fluviatilis]